jgi:hypothetical protein
MEPTIAGLSVHRERLADLDESVIPALRLLSRCIPYRPAVEVVDERVRAAFPDCVDERGLTLRKPYGEPASRAVAQALRLSDRNDLADALRHAQHPPGQAGQWGNLRRGRVEVWWARRDEKAFDNQLERHANAIAGYAEHAISAFMALGLPCPAGTEDGKPLTIVLADLQGRLGETDPSWEHIEIEQDLRGTEAIEAVTHEVFHRVQYCYNRTSDMSGFYAAIREGGARLAQQCVLFHGSSIQDGYLDTPAKPLAQPVSNSIEPHSYAASLFWKYFCEQHGEFQTVPTGFDAFIRVLEETRNGYSLGNLRRARDRVAGAGAFDNFLRVGDDIVSTETTWGNFLVANWLSGTSCEPLDRRFLHGGRLMPPPPSHSALVERLIDIGQRRGAPVTFQRGKVTAVPPFSASYYQLELSDGSPSLLRFSFDGKPCAGQENATGPLTQLLLMGRGNCLVDIIRLGGWNWEKVINVSRLERVMVIAATREAEGKFLLNVERAPPQPLVSTTRWNCAPGRSYESDPRIARWNWTSPDVAVVRDGDGFAISVQARNGGDRLAQVIAHFAWQPCAEKPNHDRWTPIHALRADAWRELGKVEDVLEPEQEASMKVQWAAPPETEDFVAIRACLGVNGMVQQNAGDKTAITLISLKDLMRGGGVN